MKILYKIDFEEKLYDGLIDNLFDLVFNVSIEEVQIKFKVSDFLNNSFENIKSIISKNDFEKLVIEGQFKNTLPNYYRNLLPDDRYQKLLDTVKYYKSEQHLGLLFFR